MGDRSRARRRALQNFAYFRRTAVRNLERAGVPRSAAMAMVVGHRTESIYRPYAIADEAMLKESARKLAAFHAAEKKIGPPTGCTNQKAE
jgi:hypothetical protein